MSRLIDPAPGGGKLLAGAEPGKKAEEYGERVAKYVPAEVIAAYLALLPIVLSGTDQETTRRTVLLAVITAVGLIFTPLYLNRFPAAKGVKVFQLLISTAAFAIWSYSIPGGLFNDLGIYDEVVASIMLVVFTLASGLLAPTKQT